MLNIITGMLNFFLVYLYYTDGRYSLAIIWAIIGTLNLVIGFLRSTVR